MHKVAKYLLITSKKKKKHQTVKLNCSSHLNSENIQQGSDMKVKEKSLELYTVTLPIFTVTHLTISARYPQ